MSLWWMWVAGMALGADEGRTFLHVEGAEVTVDLPWDAVDPSWLADLGLDRGQRRLQRRSEGLARRPVGTTRRIRVADRAGRITIATLERRPDTRWSQDDVEAMLASMADAG